MAIRPILTFPHASLKAKASAVTRFDAELATLLDDMVETMVAAAGIGLAAPQIDVRKRVVVMDCSGREETPRETFRLVNPRILWRSDVEQAMEEGCLSLPEQFAEVTRPAAIRVAYQDAKGQRQEQDFEGLEAACVQHEIDHLNGVLIWDYIGMTRRSVMQRKLKKLLKERALEAQEAQ